MNAYPSGHNDSQESTKEDSREERSFKLVEKPIEQFQIPQDNDFNGYHYAIMDLNNYLFYIMTNINRENFPPNIPQLQHINTNTSNSSTSSNNANNPNTQGGGASSIHNNQSFNFSNSNINERQPFERGGSKKLSLEFASPALGSVNFSPNLFNNNLMNMMKQSPGLGFLNDSPLIRNNNQYMNNFVPIQHQDSGMSGWNNDWTPETNFRHQDSGKMKQINMPWGGENYKGPNSPDNRFSASNSAFLRKQMENRGGNLMFTGKK